MFLGFASLPWGNSIHSGGEGGGPNSFMFLCGCWALLLFSCSVTSNSLGPPQTAARWYFPVLPISQSLLKLMSIESMMPGLDSHKMENFSPLIRFRVLFPQQEHHYNLLTTNRQSKNDAGNYWLGIWLLIYDFPLCSIIHLVASKTADTI